MTMVDNTMENRMQNRAMRDGPVVMPESQARVDAPPQPRTAYESESLGQLFSDLSSDFSLLIREEMRLAKAETRETISRATNSLVSLVAGGAIAYAGFIVVLIAVAFVLSEFMSLWLSTLLVGLVVLIVGAIMVQSGRSALRNLNVVPEKTVETLKDDAEWAKEQVR